MALLARPKRRTDDRQIAGHALALGQPVVTSNRRDFEDVAGLSVEDWSSIGPLTSGFLPTAFRAFCSW